MIEFKNIKKSFDGKDILLGVSGVFKTGKTNLIIGSSGTGSRHRAKEMQPVSLKGGTWP